MIKELIGKMKMLIENNQITQLEYDNIMKKEFKTRDEYYELLEKAKCMIENYNM